MDKIKFPYRSDGHLALLHVIHESGAWEKYGLSVDYDFFIGPDEAHEAVKKGEVEFVSGNHVTPYLARLKGDRWVYVGQTINLYAHRLVVRGDSKIQAINDLKGKKIAFRGGHPGDNNWLFLKQNGLDADKGDVALKKHRGENLWEVVQRGDCDAALLTPPDDLLGKRVGMKVIEIPPLPMVYFTTLSTSSDFAERHSALVERFLKGVVEGIHFFKTQKEKSMAILEKKLNGETPWDREMVEYLYSDLAPHLEKKPYPTVTAIQNVFELATHRDPEANEVNPLSLWNMHYLRQLDDSGFIDGLYA